MSSSEPVRPLPMRTVRERRGFSLAALALRSGLSKLSLWRIETGRQRPRPSTRVVIAEALGVPVEAVQELANGDDVQHQPHDQDQDQDHANAEAEG